MYRSLLHTIDLLYPGSVTRRGGQPVRYLSPPQQRAAAFIAGDHLRVLRLSHAAAHTLNDIPYFFHNLRELSFIDAGAVTKYVAAHAFAAAKNLRKLSIVFPRATLTVLQGVSDLRKLELLYMRDKDVCHVTSFLRDHGQQLIFLRIVLGVPPASELNCMPGMPRVKEGKSNSLATLKAIADCVTRDSVLPALEELVVEGCPGIERLHCTGADIEGFTDSVRIESLYDELSGFLEGMREDSIYTMNTRLRKVTLGAMQTMIMHCVTLFAKLFESCVEVEVQFPGAIVVFPGTETLEMPYFKSLQLSLLSTFEKPYRERLLRRLEVLDLGTYLLIHRVWQEAEVGVKVFRIMQAAGNRLVHVRCTNMFANIGWLSATCHWIASVLDTAPSVHYLEMSSWILHYAHTRHTSYLTLMAAMKNIRTFRLLTRVQQLPTWRLQNHESCFSRGLPSLLEELANNCPQLECIFLEAQDDRDSWTEDGFKADGNLAERLQAAFVALREFKARCPQVDVSSVTGQLNMWYETSCISASKKPGRLRSVCFG